MQTQIALFCLYLVVLSRPRLKYVDRKAPPIVVVLSLYVLRLHFFTTPIEDRALRARQHSSFQAPDIHGNFFWGQEKVMLPKNYLFRKRGTLVLLINLITTPQAHQPRQKVEKGSALWGH
jgi:hypothetical protein